LAAAPRLSLQEQAIPLQPVSMAPQPSSLRTSFRALSITRIEIKESGIYGGRRQGFVEGKDPILLERQLDATQDFVRWRIQFNPGIAAWFSSIT
jgi:hypothetical protein